MLYHRVPRPSPARRRPRHVLRVECLEGRTLLSGIGSITESPVPSVNLATGGIVTGPDGNLWFTEASSNAIGTINPATGTLSSFTIPTASSGPQGIAVGSDGNLWFAESGVGKVGVINPTTHAIIEFPTPTANSGPTEITAGPDGNLWFTEFRAFKVGIINPTTHAIREVALPTIQAVFGHGIAAGSDGNVWFTVQGYDEVGFINPTTLAVGYVAVDSSPEGILSGPDGNLWFTEDFTSPPKVGTINATTHAFTSFATSSNSWGLTNGPDGGIWFAEYASGKLGRIDPTSHAITESAIPDAGSVPRSITTGPDGSLWFTDFGTTAVGTAGFSTSPVTVTQQTPSRVTAGSGFGLTVAAEDASGDVLTSYNGPLTVSLGSNPGGGTLGGTTTVTASNGVASFSGLTLTRAGSGYSLNISGVGLATGTSAAFAITPAAASQIVVTQGPSGVAANTAFTVVAAVEDQYGNLVTSANNAVTIAIGTNPGVGTLGGTTTVSAVNGVVTFSNLKISKKGKGYTLKLTSAGLAGTTTDAFNVS